jgi:AcrR family transcriptional regulator
MGIEKKKSAQEVLADFRRQEIVVAAHNLLGKTGFSGMTMEKVAEEAGVSKGTIYTYFKDKAELVSVMMEKVSEDLVLTIEESTSSEGSIEERLSNLINGLNGFYKNHYQLFALIHDTGEHQKVNHEQGDARKTYNKLIAATAEIFISARDQGEIREDLDPRALAMILITTLHQLFHFGHSEKELDLHEMALSVIDIFLNGIRNRGDN